MPKRNSPSVDGPKDLDLQAPIFKGFIRGMLPFYLLFVLKQRGALHGTEMIRLLSEMSGHHWKPSPGSIYPVLRRLEKEGLLTGRWRRSQGAPQRVYRLTEEGQKALPEISSQLLNQLRNARDLIDEHLEALEQELRVK